MLVYKNSVLDTTFPDRDNWEDWMVPIFGYFWL